MLTADCVRGEHCNAIVHVAVHTLQIIASPQIGFEPLVVPVPGSMLWSCGSHCCQVADLHGAADCVRVDLLHQVRVACALG